ncbi:MAG TPA: OmcA/MtrC family decaheme c-type cytochrome [Thermoanaerobaculia bacterium]|nr:OmcA/MtrC family decaheme c-type cytochrome [Thermoanaerobaculia bacterium]HQR66509.1 OmcA/MtrC family decaheme c-type cytochrome [Thermoanaerobaculia bacterium]
MVGAQRGLFILAAIAALAVPYSPGDSFEIGPAPDGGKVGIRAPYGPSEKEYYLEAGTADVLRPGLKMTINGVTNLVSGQKPVVDFTITDDFGNPLDRTGATTPGVVTVRFAPAVWDGLFYTNLIVSGGNPSRDTAGTWQTVSDGRYLYTFATALPSFDATKPITLFAGARRTMTDILGKDYFVNTFKDGYSPDLKTTATTWGVTTTAKCNQCHNPLSLHGGNYFEVKACAICHNPNNMTSASNAAFNGQLFWHKIHAGIDPTVGPVTYPQDIRNCTTCHDTASPMSYTWFTQLPNRGTAANSGPTRAACGSCHADVNFATGKNHSPQNLPQANDNACGDCHVPQGDLEWDASVIGAHTVPYESTQLKGLKTQIVSVSNVGAGKKATVTFKITNNAGTVLNPLPFGSNLNIVLGGPTVDYGTGQTSPAQPFRENASGASFDGKQAVYTMTNAIPASATGTWTFSIECRQTVTLQKGVGGTIAYTEGAVNPIFYAAVTDAAPVARRVVVDIAKCNVCHDRLVLHGGQRFIVQECVICHNPNSNDSARRPASANPPESVQMARMIHRIHTGEEMTQIYTVYGFGGSVNNFNEVTYPGDRRDCVRCHTSMTTADLPLPTGTLNVITLRDYYSPQGPGTAACVGCHDNQDTAAHAYLNTTTFPGSTQPAEACATCHGANSEWSTTKVHAR